MTRYKSLLIKNAVPDTLHENYKKWLRYYLDFCAKYSHVSSDAKSLIFFIKKLQEKKQNIEQQKQAKDAVLCYYTLIKLTGRENLNKTSGNACVDGDVQKINEHGKNNVSRLKNVGAGLTNRPVEIRVNDNDKDDPKAAAAEWNKIFAGLSDEIKVRHYSPKTLKAYTNWVHKFRAFLRNRDPHSITSADVKECLKYLAVGKKVSASTQNQGFNALLFLFRHVLKKDFGDHTDYVWAKTKPYIPVVLSREEVDQALSNLAYPYDLAVKFLYGCGLRLFECLNLRMQGFNFDTGILTVHDGKGQKDRTVPLPVSIMGEIKANIAKVRELHKKDLENGYAGTFMKGLLEKKHKNSARETGWQWFFPAKTLTFVPHASEYRRYYLHETHVHKAIKSAARKAGLLKRVSAHTFRHSFATNLLQANYDIRTTMINTHTVRKPAQKEVKSPLDF